MSAPTEAAHPTVDDSRRTIHVTAYAEAGHYLHDHWSLDLAEAVLQKLFENQVAILGYRVDWLDDAKTVAHVIVDALNRELDEFVGERPDPSEVWAHVDDQIRSLTGDGWRVVSVR